MNMWNRIAAGFTLVMAAPILGGACTARIANPESVGSAASALSRSCYWSGADPFCGSFCGNSYRLTNASTRGDAQREMGRLGIPTSDLRNDFGNACVFGSKGLCCDTPPAGARVGCYWSGAGPFCNSNCGTAEHIGNASSWSEAQNLMASRNIFVTDTNGFGNQCVFGSKSLCCAR